MWIDCVEYEKIVPEPLEFHLQAGKRLILLTKSPFIIGHTQKSAGQLFFCHDDQSLYLRPFGGAGLIDYIIFSVTPEDAALLDTLHLPDGRASAPSHISELSSLLQSIATMHESADRYRTEKCSHFLMILLYCIASGDETPSDNSRAGLQYFRMRQLRRRLSDAPQQHPTVEDAAAYVGLSQSHFSALYKHYFGISYINDLIRIRVRRSCSMLTTTDWTVSRIAQELGYENESNYYRQFRQVIGISPAEYRKTFRR